ncbi:MAG: hypothetical protein SFV22_07410 [Saprospiraceae bacterium]|nr:hypothetical protein [Saprospiraceae bacterium]
MKQPGIFVILLVLIACRTEKPPESPDAWRKIKIDFKSLDTEGLSGGKVALNYEFCIPADDKSWKKVKKIDPTARQNGGKGRVACKDNQQLVIGSTHQKNYQRVLYELACLPFISRIEPTFWE